MFYSFVHWLYMSTIGHPNDLLDLTSKTTFMIHQTILLVDGLEFMPSKPDVEDPSFYRCTNHRDHVEMCPECDYKEDPITYETIDRNHGVCMNGLCYDIKTISALKSKKDPFTQRLLTWEEQYYIEDRADKCSSGSILLSSGYVVDFIRKLRSGTMTPAQAFLLSVAVFDSTYQSDMGNVWRLCAADVLVRAVIYMSSVAVLSASTKVGTPMDRSVTKTLHWAYQNGLIPRSECTRLMKTALVDIYHPLNDGAMASIIAELESHDIAVQSDPPTPFYD